MTEGQRAAVKELLQEIELEEAIHRKKMEGRRQELMRFVPYFESYGEMYQFIAENTMSLEQFCKDMFEARKIFDATHQ